MTKELFGGGALFNEGELADRYRHILAPEDRERLPAYAALCDALATSPTALQLLGSVNPRQQNPTLILAILHYLALRGHETLAPLYRKLHEGRPVVAADFASTVVSVVEAEPETIRRELHRSTQTNEPNRSAVLSAVIGDVARTLGHTTIDLIDVGTSMGFNLYPDLITVANEENGDDATLVTTCFTTEFTRAPVPQVNRRIGIDQNLLYPDRQEDVWWLQACLWPEETRRLRRFNALLSQMRQWPEPQRHAGNALEIIESQVQNLTTPTYIVNSWVLAYFSIDERVKWRRIMDSLFDQSELAVWISMEHPSINDSLNFPEAPKNAPRPGASQIVVSSRAWPSAHWGWTHPHGHWFSIDSGPNA